MKNDTLIVKHTPKKAATDMPGAKRESRKVFFVALCLVAAVIVTYIPVIHSDFVGYDDELYVTENKIVQEGFSSESLKWAFTTFHSGNWHPLTWLSHMLDYELYGLNPAGHHWTQVEFHIVNTVLLFFILFKMTGALYKSAFVAALFALHPLHVESVAWVSERKDLLSTFFGLMMIFAYHRYVKTSDFKIYLLIIVFLSLGLMAKPMLVTFPFVLLLLDFWPLERFQYPKNENNDLSQPGKKNYVGFKGLMRLILEKIPLFIPVAISSILTFLAQKSEGAVKTLGVLPLKTRIANALVSYVSYVSKAIWPRKLAIFYPHPGDALSGWTIIGAALLIASAILLSIRTLKKYPYIAVGLFWYLGTLVPVIGLVQVGGQAMADRYTYIPLIGLFIIIVWGASDLFKKWKYHKIFFGVSASIILTALTVCTFYQLKYWQNGITLFEHAVKATENNYAAQNNLGTALGPVDLDKAIFHYKETLKINPGYALALFNLGNVLEKKGNIDEAIEHYEEALRIKPGYAEAQNNLGIALFKKRDYERAVLHFAKALEINPQDTGARNNLANVLFIQGKPDEAVSHYDKILNIDSENADAHYNLANILSTRGRVDEAVLHYKEALRINPNYLKAHCNLGNILINQEKIKEGFSHFVQAIKLNPDYAPAYNKIGLILFKQGKFNKAGVFFSKANEIDPNDKEARKNLGVLNQALKTDNP
jgi:tetratricopeptide (TPR) repeat protein